MKTNVIEITVSGPTQTGKSVLLSEIKQHLESLNLAVVYQHSAHRLSPPPQFEKAERHEKPAVGRAVIVMIEDNTKGT